MKRLIGLSAAAATAVLVLSLSGAGSAQAAFPGRNGRVAFEELGSIYTVDKHGHDRKLLVGGGNSHSPRYSADGTMITYNRGGDIWTMRADGSNQRRLTSGPAKDINPAWAPDGKRIVFSRTTTGLTGRSLYVVSTATRAVTPLARGNDGCAVEPTWSADNRYVVYWDACFQGRDNTHALAKVDVRTHAVSTVLGPKGILWDGARVTFNYSGPDVSPDGRSVLFYADVDYLDSEYDSSGYASIGLDGNGFRMIDAMWEDDYTSGSPAFSPDGKAFLLEAGNENPQITGECVRDDVDCDGFYYSSPDAEWPYHPDWQPLR